MRFSRLGTPAISLAAVLVLIVGSAGQAFAGLTYNPDGELSTITRPNGVTSTNSYDTAGRLSGLTYKNTGGTTIAAYTYGLDAAGNRVSASTNGATDHYAIDPAGRLTGVSYADGTAVTFGYDAAGNRKSVTSGGSNTSYSYDAAGQLTSAGSTTYTYDPAGNRLSAGSSAYTYDGFGNLASATAGAATIAYRTNGAGLRVSATSGSTTTTYAWDAAAALPSLLSDGTNGYLSADSMLLAETASSANAYPLTDALGSVRGQTDASGAVTASASYGVYGDVRSSSGSVGSLGYTGALSDASGLVYLNARSMDPGTGTFTSRDPMTPGGPGVTGFNPYAYAGQNPTTYTDPSGGMAEYVATYQPEQRSIPWLKLIAGAAGAGGVVGLVWVVAQDIEKIADLLNRPTVPDSDRNPPRPETQSKPRPIPPVVLDQPKADRPWDGDPNIVVWRAMKSGLADQTLNFQPSSSDYDGLSGTLGSTLPPYWTPPQAPAWLAKTGSKGDTVRAAFPQTLEAAGFTVVMSPSPLDPWHVSIGGTLINPKSGGAQWKGDPAQRVAMRSVLLALFSIPVRP